MELPGYSLSAHLVATGRATPSNAAQLAAARQERSLIAEYYQAAAQYFGIRGYHRSARVT